jgi:predicted transporter
MGQVPRVLWGIAALGAGYLTYRRWKQHKADMKEWQKHHPPKAEGT